MQKPFLSDSCRICCYVKSYQLCSEKHKHISENAISMTGIIEDFSIIFQ